MRVVLVGVGFLAQTLARLFRRFRPLRVGFAVGKALLRLRQLICACLCRHDEAGARIVFQVTLVLVARNRRGATKIVHQLFSRGLSRAVGRAGACAQRKANSHCARNRAIHAKTLRHAHGNPSAQAVQTTGSPHWC